MKSKTLLLASTTALVLGTFALNAATLPVIDTFEGEIPGNDLYTSPGTTTGDATWTTADTNQLPVFVDRGDGDIAIEWTKGPGTRRHAFDIPPMTRGVASMDLNFIQDGDDNGNVKDAIYLRVANDPGLGAGTFAAAWIDRSAKELELNTWYTITLIFNGEDSTLNYDTTGLTDNDGLGGLGTVSPGLADVFIDGNLTTDEGNGIVSTFTYAGFIAFQSNTTPMIFQMDNFSVTEVIEDTTPKWAGYPIGPQGWVDTTPWMGWINIGPGDYVWSVAFSKYIYLPEGMVTGSGAWSYIAK
jgi:hypothetical protein